MADSLQLILSLIQFLLKALMCAFFRAPIHDFVDLLIRQQFALTNDSMMTPLWMNPPGFCEFLFGFGGSKNLNVDQKYLQ